MVASSNEANDELSVLDALVRECCAQRGEWKALVQWDAINTAYMLDLPRLRDELRELKDMAAKLAEPPLRYAVFLGPCPGSEREAVVGLGSSSMEVHIADEANTTASALTLGQQVLLNKEDNIIAVRDEYVRGETAEVINILKPDDSAEVLALIDDRPASAPRLRVQWRETEELIITCSEDVRAQGIHKGDIVRLDAAKAVATSKVRPRLHVRAGGSDGTVVEISDLLFRQGVVIGDIVRIDPGLKYAFEKLPPHETGELTLEDVPDVTYDDIGGLDDQIEQIYDAIDLPYLYRSLITRYQLTRPKGILLHGPPGCGKTLAAKAIANSLTHSIRNHLTYLERCITLYQRFASADEDPELPREYAALFAGRPGAEHDATPEAAREHLGRVLREYDIELSALDEEAQRIGAILKKKDGVRSFFLNVKGPELLDKYVGETEHRIRKIFEEARRHASYYTPVVIFFDEMEAMFRTRGSGRSSDVETTIVPQFLSEIDGVETAENLIIVGASNRHEMIDPAILRSGRLDVKISVGRPTREAARDIFALYLLPTLPLGASEPSAPEGLPLASAAAAGQVIFRTAYRLPEDPRQLARVLPEIRTLGELLPPGSDVRLACGIQPDQLTPLERAPQHLPLGDVIASLAVESPLRATLSRFKRSTPVGEFLTRLHAFTERRHSDPRVAELVERYLRRECLAESLILAAVRLLYSPSSMITWLSPDGTRHSAALKDVVSGATIASIVARAKQHALKREIKKQAKAMWPADGAEEPISIAAAPSSAGLTLDDLRSAIESEFEENREQLAQHTMTDQEDLSQIEVRLTAHERDIWREEKLRPYLEEIPSAVSANERAV